MEIVSQTNINFIAKSKISFVFSAILIIGSLYVWFSQGDSKYGIDFKGGHEVIAKIEAAQNSEDIRDSLKKGGISGSIVQSFEAGTSEYAIRIPGESTDSVLTTVRNVLKSKYNNEYQELATNFVGPTIGSELRRNALIAIVFGLIAILGYITFRFEFAFALGAVVALFHDVIICLGAYLISGRTLNMATLAAALTIVGYSVNDTIIVFDRIREEAGKDNKSSLIDLINFSINATLSRTVITSLLTLFSALALLLFGGGAIRDLSLFLVVGVIAGTYSTIFIASPVAIAWERYRASKESKS